MAKRVLLLVDPQNDFCDLPVTQAGGYRPKLAITGAYDDMKRVAQFIKGQPKGYFDEVVVTLDSHPEVAIERPGFWVTPEGSHPDPFTTISAEDVRAGRYTPIDAALKAEVLTYLDALLAAGKYAHTVWPDHCVDGQVGAQVVDVIADALKADSVCRVVYVKKGMNPLTEHYSAVKAEVVRADDPATDVNQDLVAIAVSAVELLVAGEASSHCVKATVEDLIEYAYNGDATKISLIENGMSPVYGCQAAHDAFVMNALEAGGRLISV